MTKATRQFSSEQRLEAKRMAATDAHPYCAPMWLNAIVTLTLYATIAMALWLIGFLGSALVHGMLVFREGGMTALAIIVIVSSLWLLYLLALSLYKLHRTRKHLKKMEQDDIGSDVDIE